MFSVIGGSCHGYNFCHEKKFRRDTHVFVAINFVVTKIVIVAALATDSFPALNKRANVTSTLWARVLALIHLVCFKRKS